jgi:type III secretory pathway component EscT
MQALITWLGASGDGMRTVGLAALVAARLAPCTVLSPWLSARGAPAPLRALVLFALTAALTPTALGSAGALPHDAPSFVGLALRELVIGMVFAVVVAIPLHALDHAGRILDALRGAGSAESSSPGGESTTPLGNLHGMLGTLVFLGLGGHLAVLSALGRGLVAMPPGQPLASGALPAFLLGSVHLVTMALTLAVSFAAPTLVTLVVVEATLGLVGRAAPAMPVHFAGMPLRAAVGLGTVLLTLAVLLPRLAPLFGDALRAAESAVSRLATGP